jgi:hypothetical protein
MASGGKGGHPIKTLEGVYDYGPGSNPRFESQGIPGGDGGEGGIGGTIVAGGGGVGASTVLEDPLHPEVDHPKPWYSVINSGYGHWDGENIGGGGGGGRGGSLKSRGY